MVKVNFLFVSSGLSGTFSGVFLNIWSDIFLGLFIENPQASSQIDSGISQAIRDTNKISMSKNIFGDNSVETTVTAEKTSFKRNTVDVWPNYGYFKQQACDYGVDKESMLGNSIIYMNQGYQPWKDNKKIYYADYFLIGQVNESLNPPENLETYEFKGREVKMFPPRYDNVTGHFQGLYEFLGYIMVRRDADEHFLDYGYSKQNSKILRSFHKKRMPNSFSGTFFNRHKIQHESGALQTNFSRIYYFLSSITDHVKEINRHMGSVNLLPIDISEETFEVDGMPFDPSKLDYDNPDKEKMTQTVVKML